MKTKLLLFLTLVLFGWSSIANAQQTFSTFQAANLVIGQSNFTSSSGSCTQASTNGPAYCAISSQGMLAVANQGGYRIQLWTSTVTASGQLPNIVLGESNFTDCNGGTNQNVTSYINGVAFSPDGNKIIVADGGNNRILIWNSIPTSNGQPADVVLGQTNFTTSTSGTAADKFDSPTGVFVTNGGKLIVSDMNNNRVLVWNSLPAINGTPADVVIGQTGFTTLSSGSAANQLNQPWGVWVSPDGKLLIADAGNGGGNGNNRVLVFNSVPTTNNANADVVIGQTGFGISTPGLSQTKLSTPIGVTVSPDGKLAIAEYDNNRVLIYNAIPTSNGAAADVVLGQPNFTTGTAFYPGGTASSQNINHPYNVSFDLYGRLFVIGRDMNRGLIFGTLPTQQAELQIQISVGSTTFCPGDSATITVTITNNGPNVATGIVATASLPASFTFSSSTVFAGTYDSTSGYWNIASLASGATATLTINGISTTSGIYSAYANIIQSNQLDNNLNNNGTSVDYDVNCPCTGTPNPGNTLSSSNSACSGVDFTLSLQNIVSAGGIAYQWQSSPDSSTWTNISGATNAALTISQTVSTYYRCLVTCSNSGLSANSVSLNVTMNLTSCYCIPPTSGNPCSAMWITNITTSGGVSDFNSNSACSSSSYTDLSGSYSASNLQLSTTTISFSSSGYAMAFSVWIDYNDNGIFESSEQVIANDNTAQALTFTDNFTVPNSAAPGTHKMRVRGEYSLAPTDPCNQLSYGETEDYDFTVIALTPCSGAPNPGNTLSSSNPVCSGVNFTLSLQNIVSAGGIAYQWQSSPDSSTWTNISGATNAALTISQTASTYYRCVVTCSNSGLSANSTFLNITMNSTSNCYCIPPASTDACSVMWVTNITTSGGVSDFNNNSACSNSSYTDFSGSDSASNLQLSTTTVSFTSSNYAMAFSVWIDYNDNGIFESSEQVIANDNTAQTLTFTDNFTVPNSAAPGTHKMRVRGEYSVAPTDPCNQLSYGETEDYDFIVIALTPCTGTPNPGNTLSSSNSACSGVNFTLSLQNNVAAGGIIYQWQSSPDNSTWANISGATNAALTISQTASTYYRCIVTCSNGGLSANSTFLNITMNSVSNCYCIPPTSGNACSAMWITNITTSGGVSDFNNNSACSNSSYTDFSGSDNASNSQLGTTTVSFTSSGYAMAFSVWIDFNDNGIFESSEQVIANDNTAQALTFTDNFTVPFSATPGTHKMRVRGEYSVAPTDPCNQLDYGETEDYDFTVIALAPCSGTPAPGNTLSSISPVCSGVNFTLSLQNNVAAGGNTYQWQSSSDNSTWVNISGATDALLTTSETVATYYRCIVTCSNSGLSANSVSLIVTMSLTANCYCTSQATSTSDEEILNVTVGTLNNPSDCYTTGGAGSTLNEYSDYTTIVASPNLIPGASVTFSIQIGTCNGNYGSGTAIFIDYNQNGSFADAGELVYGTSGTSNGPHYVTGSFTVSSTALMGITRMRIINAEGTSGINISSCSTYGYGETEDYAVKIACSVSPTITTFNSASFCGPGIVTLGASASSGTINWYATSTGGTSLGTGTSFNTPLISTTTTYYVDATENDCTTGTRTAVTATINALPSIPTIIANGSTLASSTGTTYQWYFGNVLIVGATSQYYTATQFGFFQVMITSAYGCSAISDPFLYTGIESEVLDNTLSIYPNPFTSQTTITFIKEQRGTIIKILDVLGKEIISINFKGKQLTIEKGEMKKGIYFVQIIDENKNVVNKKIIIQ